MVRLRQRDLLAVLEFVHEAAGLVGGEDVFPAAALDALARLVPADSVVYCELDRRVGRILRNVPSSVDEDLEALFWRIVPDHPLCRYQVSTGDFDAVKLSDFLTLRRLRPSRVYAEWFRPNGIEHELEVAIPSPLSHTKTFLFDRGPGRDFTERDRTVLNVLQPHLVRLYELARLRSAAGEPDGGNGEPPLTAREREVLAYVRAGLTNAEVAQRLWLSPNTVRRHLENAYRKLGVHTRTAAVARLGERPRG